MPIVDTPMSRPPAHDISVMPMTRPRRSYGTRSLTHAPRPRSNSTLLWLSTTSATATANRADPPWYSHVPRSETVANAYPTPTSATAPTAWTPPALSHGLLYIQQNEPARDGTRPRLLCYDLRAK